MARLRTVLAALVGAATVATTTAAPPAGASTGLVVDPVVFVTSTPGIGHVPANQTLRIDELVIPSVYDGAFACTAVTGEEFTLAVTGGSVSPSGASAAPETLQVGVGTVDGTLSLSGRATVARQGVVSVYTLPVVVRMAVTGTYARIAADWDLHLAATSPQVEIRFDPDLTCGSTTVDAHVAATPAFADGQTGRITRFTGPAAYRFSPAP